jgi:ribonuclease D
MHAFINSEKALLAFCDELGECSWIALDTEFIREKTYYPQLCLIQVATKHSIACIDPLSLKSLSPLLKILYNQNIIKVLHSAYQDLEIFYHLTGSVPSPVFDTQLAASMLGYGDQLGYAPLVKRELQITVDKSQSRTNWNLRPLDNEQLHYAFNDVRYLCQLYPMLSTRLSEKGQFDWLIEDCEKQYQEENFKVSFEDAWQRVRGARNLRSQQLAVLQALTAWRERQAMAKNLPRRWILSDSVLLALSLAGPQSLQSLANTGGISKKLIRKYGEQLTKIIENALDTPQTLWPRYESYYHRQLSSEQKAQIELMMTLVNHYATVYNLTPSTLATRSQLVKIIMGQRDVPVMTGWRATVIGDKLLAALEEASTKSNLRAQNHNI